MLPVIKVSKGATTKNMLPTYDKINIVANTIIGGW